jgi:hypothetical protein
MYFEIGNEENDATKNPAQVWTTFPSWYAQAAQGLQMYLATNVASSPYPNYVAGHPAFANYHFLTGGVVGPTPFVGCVNPSNHLTYNVSTLQQGLSTAQTSETDPDPSNPINLPAVAAAHLAVASHPYGYITPPPYAANVWPNYWLLGGNYYGDCEDLNGLIGNWESYYFPGYRHVATEDNADLIKISSGSPQGNANLEGAFILDLFTWLYNNLGADGQWGYVGGEAAYPFNLMWFEGYDTPGVGTLGLLQRSLFGSSRIGTDKSITFTTSCPGVPAIGFNTGMTLTFLMTHMDLVGNPKTPGNHC